MKAFLNQNDTDTTYSRTKSVFHFILPPLQDTAGRRRRGLMVEHGMLSSPTPSHNTTFSALIIDSRLARELNTIISVFPNHLVVLSGSSTDTLNTRSTEPNLTWPQVGIFAHYQLLTPGLITTLLVTFFILVPIVLTGISALANIQSPLRTGVPQGYSAQEKKSQ